MTIYCPLLRKQTILLLAILLIPQFVRAQAQIANSEGIVWRQVRILDLNSMPWTSKRLQGWRFKDIYANPTTGAASWLVFTPPNWSTSTPRHYDHENGWYYFLEGQFGVVYYKNPQDQTGTLYRVKAGDLFYGIEGAIHSFDQRTLMPEGCILLSWHDKPTSITPVPLDSQETTFHGGPWPAAKMVDTREIEWDKSEDGSLAKSLYRSGGAVMEMKYYPPGWKSSGPRQYADHMRWMYVLEGQMNLRLYRWPADAYGNVVQVTKGQVVEAPSHSIFGGGNTIESGESGTWVLVWQEQAGNIFKLE